MATIDPYDWPGECAPGGAPTSSAADPPRVDIYSPDALYDQAVGAVVAILCRKCCVWVPDAAAAEHARGHERSDDAPSRGFGAPADGPAEGNDAGA